MNILMQCCRRFNHLQSLLCHVVKCFYFTTSEVHLNNVFHSWLMYMYNVQVSEGEKKLNLLNIPFEVITVFLWKKHTGLIRNFSLKTFKKYSSGELEKNYSKTMKHIQIVLKKLYFYTIKAAKDANLAVLRVDCAQFAPAFISSKV